MTGIQLFVGMVGTAIIVATAGCTAFNTAGEPPEQLVTQQAEQRWQAIIAGDWKTAYSYASPAYREAVTLEGFKASVNGPVRRKAVKVKSVECSEASCTVVLGMRYEPMMPGYGEMQTEFDEKWVEQDGRWYIYQRL